MQWDIAIRVGHSLPQAPMPLWSRGLHTSFALRGPQYSSRSNCSVIRPIMHRFPAQFRHVGSQAGVFHLRWPSPRCCRRREAEAPALTGWGVYGPVTCVHADRGPRAIKCSGTHGHYPHEWSQAGSERITCWPVGTTRSRGGARGPSTGQSSDNALPQWSRRGQAVYVPVPAQVPGVAAQVLSGGLVRPGRAGRAGKE